MNGAWYGRLTSGQRCKFCSMTHPYCSANCGHPIPFASKDEVLCGEAVFISGPLAMAGVKAPAPTFGTPEFRAFLENDEATRLCRALKARSHG